MSDVFLYDALQILGCLVKVTQTLHSAASQRADYPHG